MEECLFCKIASGEIPSKKIFENDSTIAFLDINPANKGHTLVAPKNHAETIFDISESDLKEVIATVKKIAQKVKDKMNVDGLNIVQNNGEQAGQIVKHLHFHIIPRHEGDKVVITYQRNQLSDDEMNDVQKTLSEESAIASSTPVEQSVQEHVKEEPKKRPEHEFDLEF